MTRPVRATASSAPAANLDHIDDLSPLVQRPGGWRTRASPCGKGRSTSSGSPSAISCPTARWNGCVRFKRTFQRRIVVRPRRRIPRLAGGVDVAYPSPDVGVAAYALVETATGRLVWSATVRRPVAFPYISTYLSFREIPILLELLDEVRAAGRLAEVLLVDGSGIMHHRHAGIASHLGVVASLPTIGVTKKLLCGQVDMREMGAGESRPVWESEKTRLLGVALRPTAGSLRPIFVSPGHRVNVTFSRTIGPSVALRPPSARADLLGGSAQSEKSGVLTRRWA